MKKTYAISGMTCESCASKVTQELSKVGGVEGVTVNLGNKEAEIHLNGPVKFEDLKAALPKKYGMEEKKVNRTEGHDLVAERSKFGQLKPLFLIFAYLFGATILLHFKDWNTQEAMLDFMGLFYIVFSFFKFLDLKGFPESFRRYDPLARVIPVYGWIYPFLEVVLGLMFLMRIQTQVALWITIVVLGITTVGVVTTLLDKKSIRCACLGTALNLPMTEATFIENAIMLVMAISMLAA